MTGLALPTDTLPAPVETVMPGARLLAITPPSQNAFFGFHDVSPWSPDNSLIALHRLGAGWDAMANSTSEAEICVWHPEGDRLVPIGRTTAWNFQQGARLQWVPGEPGALIFNRMDGDRLVAAIVSAQGAPQGEIDGGIYSIAASGEWGLTIDFAALAERWPAYGYRVLAGREHAVPFEQNGLWRVDMRSGKRALLVALGDVIAAAGMSADPARGHFISHPSISPDGKRIVFVHRFFSPDGGLFTSMLCCDADGSRIRSIAEEKASHFDWVDSRTLLVWARFAGAGLAKARAAGSLDKAWLRPALNLARRFTGRWKKRLLAESYYLIDVDEPANRKRYGWPHLDSDGHPMFARSHRFLVTDTYPDDRGSMPLILWDREAEKRVDVARITDGVVTADTDAKCDLHPRWDRTETRIAVDCCSEGRRAVALFDVSKIVQPAS